MKIIFPTLCMAHKKAFIYWSCENDLLCNAQPHCTITIKLAQYALDMYWQKPGVTSNIPIFKW